MSLNTLFAHRSGRVISPRDFDDTRLSFARKCGRTQQEHMLSRTFASPRLVKDLNASRCERRKKPMIPVNFVNLGRRFRTLRATVNFVNFGLWPGVDGASG